MNRAIYALLLASSAALPAQEATRVRQAGRVTQQDGTPWAGVRLHFVSRILAFDADVGASDVVETTTDARGRFHAALLDGRSYSVWGFGKGARRTGVAGDVLPGRPVRLAEAEPQCLARVKLAGAGAWRAHTALDVAFVTRTRNALRIPAQLGRGDTVTVPELPGTSCKLEARIHGGPIIAETLLETGTVAPTVRLPFPRVVHCRVVARTTSKPIVGARLVSQYAQLWRVHAISDAGGNCRFVMPFPSDEQPRRFMFCAHAAGFGETVSGVTLDPRLASTAAKPAFTLRLHEAHWLEGRVLSKPNVPAAGKTILYWAAHAYDNGAWRTTQHPFVTRTNADGGFALPPAASARRRNMIWYEIDLIDDTVVPLAVGTLRDGEPRIRRALGPFVLSEFRRIDVSVRRADGTPAAAAEVLCVDKTQRGGVANGRTLTYRTNRRGNVRLALPHAGWQLGVSDAGAIGVLESLPSGTSAVLELSAPVRLRGRIVNSSGIALPHAKVSWNPDRREFQGLRMRLVNGLRRSGIESDAQGRFEVDLPCAETTYWFQATVKIGDKVYGTPRSQAIRVGKDAVDAEIEIAGAPDPKR